MKTTATKEATMQEYMRTVMKALNAPEPYRFALEAKARMIWKRLPKSEQDRIARCWACETR